MYKIHSSDSPFRQQGNLSMDYNTLSACTRLNQQPNAMRLAIDLLTLNFLLLPVHPPKHRLLLPRSIATHQTPFHTQ